MNSKDSVPGAVAYPGRHSTADELRELPDSTLLRLCRAARAFAEDGDDSADRWESAALLDDIYEAAEIPDIKVPPFPWDPKTSS